MRNLSSITRESLTLSLWTALFIGGIQTAFAAGSMQNYLASPISWLNFILYALGGFSLMVAAFFLPVMVVAFMRGLFIREWDRTSIRLFLLSGALGTLSTAGIAGFAPNIVLPLVAGGSIVRSGIAVLFLVFSAYFVSYVLSIGILRLLESRPQRSQSGFFWKWWIVLAIVPAIGQWTGVLLGDNAAILKWIITAVALVVVLFIAVHFVRKVSDWLENGGIVRPWLGIAILVAVYVLTRPLPQAVRSGIPATEEFPPVVFITIDTLRPDALGCYPEGLCLRLGTPNIDSIADEGTVFDHAYSTSPWTLPSVASYLTGLHPSAHGAVDETSPQLTQGATTLAEILHDEGYVTCGIAVNAFLADGSGIEQGFDCYLEEQTFQREDRRLLFQQLYNRIRLSWPEPFAPNRYRYMDRDAVRRANAFIKSHGDSRFFLWLHLYAPHITYNPPREYRERVKNELGITVPLADMVHQEDMKEGWPAVTHERLDGLLGMYAGEVAFSDDLVGSVVQQLRDEGIFNQSLVVVSSDHGEEFFEQDRFVHGHSLYLEQMHVPLIMRWPGRIPEGGRIGRRVSLVDLPPTILDLVHVEHSLLGSPAEFTGDSLISVFGESPEEPRPIFFEDPLLFDRSIKGIIENDLFYIGGTDSVLYPRLYDLSDDPETHYNILRDRPGDVAHLSSLLEEHISQCESVALRIHAGGGIEATELFRSLGYIR